MAIYKDNANLVALWSLDEASGEARLDYTPNNNDLADATTVANDAADKQEGAASADFIAANSEFLSLADAAQTGLDDPRTIVFWVKFDRAGGNTEGVLGKGMTEGIYQYQVYRQSGDPYEIRIRLSTDGTNFVNFDADSGTSEATWYHIAIVLTGAVVIFYLDGYVDSAEPGEWASATYNGNGTFVVGDRANGAGVFLDGHLDEVAIFNAVLSAANVLDIFTNGIQDPHAGGGTVPPLAMYYARMRQ